MTTLIDTLIAEQREVEEHFAWSAVVDPFGALEDCGWLAPESFIDENIRKFWARLKSVSMKDAGEATTIAIEMGIYFDLYDSCCHDASTLFHKEWAEQISKSAYLRTVIDKNQAIVKAVTERDVNKVRQAIQDIESVDCDDGVKCGSSPEQAHQDFMEVARNPGSAVKCFLPQIDQMIGGFYPPELTLLAARPGIGKTALLLQIARSIAYNRRKVLIVSIEMSRQQLWARMACGDAGLEWVKVRAGDVSPEQLDTLEDTSQSLTVSLGNNLIIDDESVSVYDIHKSCIVNKPDILLVDQLPDIVWHDPKAKPIEWLGEALKYIRGNICKRMYIPSIVIHQLNRGVENRTDRRPELSDLRDTGVAEQRADIVLLAYRDDYYNGRPPGVTKVPFELRTAKHRQGDAGKVTAILEYDLKAQWFA